MQLYHFLAARPRMQAVHVLGYEGEIKSPALELRQHPVAQVRRGLRHEGASPLLPLPYEARISSERFRGRELLRVVACPEPGMGLA